MRYETTMVAVLTLTAWLSFTCPTRSEPRRQLEEQTRFSLEEPIKHPVPIPEDVLKILRQEADITTCEIRPEERSKIPPSWYEASGIRLDGEREEDLIVKPRTHACGGRISDPFGSSDRVLTATTWFYPQLPSVFKSLSPAPTGFVISGRPRSSPGSQPTVITDSTVTRINWQAAKNPSTVDPSHVEITLKIRNESAAPSWPNTTMALFPPLPPTNIFMRAASAS